MEDNKNKILQAWDYKPYVFINTVVSEVYTDIPMEIAFPSKPAPYIPEINKYVTTDYFLNSSLPSVYTYFTVFDNDGKPVAIYGKCARKTNAISVCRYTQAAGWPWSEGELYRDAFDSLLRFGFYSEAEVDALSAGAAAARFGCGQDSAPLDVTFQIHPSALRALVYAAFLRWQRSDPLVRIGVPAQYKGEAYNAYVLSAVRTLYSYFPVGLKAKAGFSSYLPVGKEKNLPSLYFGFVPQEEADSATLFLDGSSLAVYEKMPKTLGKKSLDYFINSLLGMEDPAARQSFIEKVFTDVDGKNKIQGLTPVKYTYFSDTLLLLNHEKSTLEMMPEWIRFCNAPEQYPSSLVPELYNAIKTELNAQVFADYMDAEYPDSMTLEAFAEKYKQITNLCCTSSTLREGFWNRLDAFLTNCRASNAEVLTFLQQQEKGLKRIGLARYQQTYEQWRSRLAVQVKREAFAAMDSFKGSYEQSRQQFKQIRKQAVESLKLAFTPDEAAAILREIQEHGSELTVKSIMAAFLPISRRKVENSAEIQSVISEAEGIFRALETENGPTADEARKLVSDFINVRSQSLGQRDVVKRRIFSELRMQQDYFAAIEIISANMAANNSLEKPDQDAFLAQIRNLKPQTEREYRTVFQSRYGKALTFENLTHLDPLVMACVLKDLSAFFATPYRLGKSNLSARELRDKIVHRQAQVQQFQEGQSLTVDLDGAKLNAELLKTILTPDAGRKISRENLRVVEDGTLALAESGVFGGEEMYAIFAMFIQNDLKIKKLLGLMFAGCFRNASEDDYMRTLEAAYQSLRSQGRKAPVEDISDVLAHQRSADSTAKNAFTRFAKGKARAAGKKGLHPAAISTIVLGVVTVLLIVGSVLLFLACRNKDQTIETLEKQHNAQENDSILKQLYLQQQTIQELEEQLGRPVDLEFVEGSFVSYAMPLHNLAKPDADYDLYQVFNNRYLRLNKDYIVASVNGTDITWSEYFFWECYFASCEAQPITAETFDQDDVQAQVNAALILTHTNLLAPGTPAEAGTSKSIPVLSTPSPEQDLASDVEDIIKLVRTIYGTQMEFNHRASLYFEPLPEVTFPEETAAETIPETVAETTPETSVPEASSDSAAESVDPNAPVG